MVYNYYKCKKRVEFDQIYYAVLKAIMYVEEKRVWENKKSSLYSDYAAPEKCFNVAFKKFMGRHLAAENTYKRRANFNPLSVDSLREDYKDYADAILVQDWEKSVDYLSLMFYDYDDYCSGLILYICAYYNCYYVRKYVMELKPENFEKINSVVSSCEDREKYLKALEKLQNMNYTDFNINIKKLFYILRNSKFEFMNELWGD